MRISRHPTDLGTHTPPRVLVDANKILTDVGYAVLNPTRAGLVDDPLAWYWSTYRDLFGATHDPWVTFERRRRYLPAHVVDLERLHALVSADLSTDPRGTPPPRMAFAEELDGRPVAELLAAA